MRATSCYSTKLDPYRAGMELGRKLAEIQPEVVFIFPSIHYEGSKDLTEAIYDALDNPDTVLIGNTGDGFYERGLVANAGVSALGINSEGKVNWHLACEPNVGSDPEGAVERCMQRLADQYGEKEPAFFYMAADFRTDTTAIDQALARCTSKPVVGGSAADDFSFKRSFIYANRQVCEDCIALLAVEGEVAFDIHLSQDMTPIGNTGTVTECSSKTIVSIDDIPAGKFIEQETGQPLNTADEGILTLKVMNDEMRDQRLRSLLISHGCDEVDLFGSIDTGDRVHVCYASPDKIIDDVKQMTGKAANLPFEPVASLMVSCAGRKKALGSKVGQEVEEVVNGCPSLQALAGYPSYGEFGPIREAGGYSRTLFHNMTCILLLIGEA